MIKVHSINATRNGSIDITTAGQVYDAWVHNNELLIINDNGDEEWILQRSGSPRFFKNNFEFVDQTITIDNVWNRIDGLKSIEHPDDAYDRAMSIL